MFFEYPLILLHLQGSLYGKEERGLSVFCLIILFAHFFDPHSIFIAIFAWHMPAQQAFESIGNGIVFANWPIMWIVVNAMYVSIVVRENLT